MTLPQQHAFRNAQVIVPAASFGTPVLLFQANITRVSLIMNCKFQHGTSLLNICINGIVGKEIYSAVTPTSIIMPYRDWGPIIREAIYASGGDGINDMTVFGTEVYYLP